MKNWSAEEIKGLRLRLGWSAADFSRHFGCQANLVLDWERGVHSPSPDDILQLTRLEHHLFVYSEQMERAPLADSTLHNHGLEQIYEEQIRRLNKELSRGS